MRKRNEIGEKSNEMDSNGDTIASYQNWDIHHTY